MITYLRYPALRRSTFPRLQPQGMRLINKSASRETPHHISPPTFHLLSLTVSSFEIPQLLRNPVLFMERTQEFRIISALAEPDNSITNAPLAVQQLLALTSTAYRSNGLGSHLNNTWLSLIEIVARTPSDRQTALVEFTRVLQQQKVINPADGKLVGFEEDYNKLVWTEVPNMGICIADEWNFGKSEMFYL